MLHKLHLCTGQFKHVAIFERHGFCAYGGSVERRLADTLYVSDDKPIRSFGDGRYRDPRLAYGCDYLDQRYFPASGRA